MSEFAGDKDAAAPGTGFVDRLRMAVPHPAIVLGIGIFWGLAMAISAFAALFMRLRFDVITPVPTIGLFFCGGAVAAPLACFFAVLLLGRKKGGLTDAILRFATFSALLSLGTFAMTALLFALQYRLYYAQWHAHFGTKIWLYQFAYTSASAVYQFAVFGANLYWPLAPVFVLIFGLWFVRRPH